VQHAGQANLDFGSFGDWKIDKTVDHLLKAASIDNAGICDVVPNFDTRGCFESAPMFGYGEPCSGGPGQGLVSIPSTVRRRPRGGAVAHSALGARWYRFRISAEN
jgi:hypothetical protein